MASLAKAKRPKRPAPRSCLGPVADLEAHLPAEWWRKLFNALYVKTDGDVVENVGEHAPRRRLHPRRRASAAAQPDPRPVLRPGPPLPRARAPRLQERHRRRPLALSRAPRQEAGAERAAAGRVQGRRRAQPAPAGDELRLRRHHGQLVRLLLQQAGRREGARRRRQDPAPLRPARARHHRRRLYGRSLRAPLVGMDRRASLRLPRALAVQRPRPPDLARGHRPRRAGRHRRPVLRRAPLHAREHRQADGEDRLPQRAPSRQRRGAVGSRPGSRHDGAPYPAVGRRAAASCPQARQGAA